MRAGLAPALVALAALATPAAAQDLAEGRQLYLDACAACHGPDGQGDGPMRQILTLPVPDLTALAARNGGRFPWLTTLSRIDGRSGLSGHGDPMPVFGTLLRGPAVVVDGPDGTPVIAPAAVVALLAWLEMVQR